MRKNVQCRIVSAKDYALVQGLPGTGKTSTISVAVMSLLAAGNLFLLTSYTNSAVDNIMLKLKEKGAHMLRLGRAEGVHREMQPYMLGGAKFPRTRSSDLKTIMRDVNLASPGRAYELAEPTSYYHEIFCSCVHLQILCKCRSDRFIQEAARPLSWLFQNALFQAFQNIFVQWSAHLADVIVAQHLQSVLDTML